MSLIVHGGSVPGKLVSEAMESPMIMLSTSAISVIMGIILFRGIFSLIKDALRLFRKVFMAKYEDKGVQTEYYFPQLPGEIFWNPGSEVYHLSGCHHVGVRGIRKQACSLCRNRF